MIRIILLIFLLILGACSVKDEPGPDPSPTEQNDLKTFGGTGNDEGGNIFQTEDGGYLLSGTTNSFGSGGIDSYLIKINNNFESEWSKTYGGVNNEYGKAISSGDGGFLVFGTTNSFGAGNTDIYIEKVNNLGERIWFTTFGGTEEDGCSSAIIDANGGYVLTGWTKSIDQDDFRDAYIIKIDGNGNRLWSNNFGTNNRDITINGIVQTDDGGFILTGSSTLRENSERAVYTIKVDNSGNLIWENLLSGNGSGDGHDICVCNNGDVLIIGISDPIGTNNINTLLLRIDQNGNEIWNKNVGNAFTDYAYGVSNLRNGGFLITGETRTRTGDIDLFVTKLDESGNELWSKSFGGTRMDWGSKVIENNSNQYIVFGRTESFGMGGSDFYVLKLNSEGNLLEF